MESNYTPFWNVESNSTNSSGGRIFFGTYYSFVRFGAECGLAVLAVACNAIALGLSKKHRYHHHAYRALFWNMSISNALTAIATCLCNNSMLLWRIFPYFNPHSLCHGLAALASANLLCMALGVVSGLTLLGFALVHYLLLCQPLKSDRLLSPHKVRSSLIALWVSVFVLGVILSSYGVSIVMSDTCDIDDVDIYNMLSSDVFLVIISIGYIAVVCLTIRLYVEIRGLSENLGRYVWVDDLQLERQALRTLILLLASTSFFWAPYSLLYAISINMTSLNAFAGYLQIIYYMNMLPYIKFCVDPLIYGKRMLGLQQEISRLAYKCKKTKRSRQNKTRVYRFTKPLVKV